jgi:hypothetical protein
MDANTHYWLNRVAIKLHQLYFSGIDFKLDEGRWLFDWNEDLATEANLQNVAAEDKALTIFTQTGVIKSTHKDNFYLSQQLESFADPLRGHVIWGSWDKFDAPKREYDYLRFIDGLDWDKFLEFCGEYGLSYKEDAVPATLEIKNQVPIVHVGERTYTLKTLQDGSTLDAIQAAYDHADESFGFDELRRWTKKPFEAKTRFTDIFRKNKNEFSNGMVLNPFVNITTKSFRLNKKALLTPAQLSAIQKNSTN